MHRYLNVPVAGTYDVYVYVINAAGGGNNPLCEHAWKGAPYPNYASVTTSSPYTVTYNANGGSGAPAATTKSYGINLTLSSTQPTRSGYLFTGWNTAADGSGTTYNSGATYSGNANLTLYAQWAQSGNNSVEMASGTHDASHWSFSSNTANFGNTITVNYSGYLNLQSVTLRRKTTNTFELNSSNISTAVSNFNSQSGSRLVFTANISEQQTFTCTEGEIDMNGHSSSKDLFIRNNELGKTITIKNGTVTGTDGAGGFNDYYNGTVVLENMTVTGRVWTDGHPYVINGGTYAEIINDKNADTPGIVTIYNGKISQLGNWGSGGTFTLYGGKYAINPSSLDYCTIPSGYSVQSNTDSDSSTYPWVVRNTSSPVANPYSLAVTEVTANRQWTFTMPPYDVEVVAHYAPFIPYFAYNTATNTYEELDAPNCTAVTTSTTTMGAANTETWYLVNSNVTVNNTRIEVLGTVNLILTDGKSLRAEKGIHVPPGVTLNIYGQSGGTGQLYGFSNTNYIAGIGGNSGEASGTVNIHGGTIQAWGADNSAGIGGGRNGNGGTTTIYGGSVNSTGVEGGAGIGGGYEGNGGIITIYGGDVVARGSYKWGAGIGGGRNGNGGTISIYGGTINATGGEAAAGIGGGIAANCGIITITGGTVIAQAKTVYDGDKSQAIGSGAGTVSGGTLTIDNMRVYSSANAANPVAPANHQSTCHSKYAKLMLCSPHNFVNGVCTICGSTPDVDNPGTYLAYQTTLHIFTEHTVPNPINVYSSTTTLGVDGTETWYSVNRNVTVSDRITVRGTVHLILCDGKTLTSSSGITVHEGNTLNIYGQAEGTGAIVATASGGNFAGIGTEGNDGGAKTLGTVNIHGGYISATGGAWSAGIGGGVGCGGGNINIYGGHISAIGKDGEAQAIGKGSSGADVTRTIAYGLRVYYNNNSTPTTYNDHMGGLGQKTVRVEPCTEHINDICTYCGFPHYGHVTYNDNNATSGTVPTDATNYESYTVITVPDNTGNLARIGYTFAGWNTAANGSGINFAPGATFTIYGNVTLYAKWTPINYTVRFHKNHDDATGTMSEQTFTFDVVQPLTVNAFTLDNYLFAGWNTTTNGIVTYTDGQSVSNLATVQDAVVNLYALWTQNLYTITYDLNGGSVATPNPTTYTDLSRDITLANPTREGYGFIGWTGTGLSEPTMTVTIPAGSTGNRSYTANWNEGVVYYAYNTTINMFETRVVPDNITSVTSSTTTMGANNTETWYLVDDNVTVSSRIMVNGTVHLILCDGKTLTANGGIAVTEGKSLYIYSQRERTGCLTATATDGAGIGGGSVGNITIHGGNITATGGDWSAGIGGGTNGGGGSITIYSGNVEGTSGRTYGNAAGIGHGSSGGAVAIQADGLRLQYYDYGWKDVTYGLRATVLEYPHVKFFPCTEHSYSYGRCTLCGKYEWYTVTYDGNGNTGGSVPTDNTHYPLDGTGTITVLGNTGNLTRTGYIFAGWNTRADGSGTDYAPDAAFNVTSFVTLYARWTPITYTVRFIKNHNYASGTMDDQSFTYAVAQPLTANGFTAPAGISFVGWSITPNGYVVYTDRQRVNNLATVQDAVVNLYAQYAITLANNADNDDAISVANGERHDVTLADRTLYRDGDWNTLCLPFALASFCGTPLEGATVKTLESTDFNDGTLTMTFTDNLTSIEAGKPYIVKWTEEAMAELGADLVIRSVADWNTFVSNVTGGMESYQGKVVKLAADISVSTMVGDESHPFKGTFDGCGHTLTFNYTTDADNAAPFQWIMNAVIKNLTVMGEIRSSQMFAAGLVARAYGDNTIENCVSSVTIHATKVGDGTHGGFVGRIENDCKTFTFTDCKFNGTFDGSNTDNWCPFAAWSMGNDNTHFTFNNCLYAPASTNVRGGCATFYRNGTATLNGAYYTQAIGTAQGINASGMSNETLVSNLGSGWEISNGQVVPKMENSVANIVNPTFENVLVSAATADVSTTDAEFIGSYAPITDAGLLLDAHNPNGDAMHAALRLTLSEPTRDGYTFGGWYTDNGFTTPLSTTIPFTADGNVTLYGKWLTEELELANNGDNSSAISEAAASSKYHNVTLADRTIYKDGDWNTLVLPFSLASLTGTPLEGLTVKTLESTDFADGTLTMNFSDDLTSIEAGKPYIVKDNAALVIRTAADWNTFASNVTNGTETYEGKTVKLAADISVSTMVGTDGKEFKGTFDGCGHTLNVTLSGSGYYVAPFSYVNGCTIKNLIVTGTVNGGMHCSGLIGGGGGSTNTSLIENCDVRVAVNCNQGSKKTHCGGFIGHSLSGSFTFRNCKFSGSISGATNYTGVFMGWAGHPATHINCLAAGTYSYGGTLVISKGTNTYDNCYTTWSIGSDFTYTTDTGSDLLALLGDGWEIRNDQVVPKMNPHIVNPVFENVLVSDATANVETEYVDFIGNYSSLTLTGGDKSVLYLGTNNQLYYPAANRTINACRAYFQLNGITAGDISHEVKMYFGDEDDADGINSLTPDPSPGRGEENDAWYSLDGKKLSGKPSQKGIYIHNGRKEAVK